LTATDDICNGIFSTVKNSGRADLPSSKQKLNSVTGLLDKEGRRKIPSFVKQKVASSPAFLV
jgi:hypothetical protein